MHHTGKYSQHSSIIWPVWLNGWVFVCKLSSCGIESHCCLLKMNIEKVKVVSKNACKGASFSTQTLEKPGGDSFINGQQDFAVQKLVCKETLEFSTYRMLSFDQWPK